MYYLKEGDMWMPLVSSQNKDKFIGPFTHEQMEPFTHEELNRLTHRKIEGVNE